MWNLLTLRGICAQPAIYFLTSPQGAGSAGQAHVNKASANDAIKQMQHNVIKTGDKVLVSGVAKLL
jgi:hypothetical protein